MKIKQQQLGNQSLGTVVKELRQNKKMTVTELAQKTGVCRSYLTMIEQGKANPSIDLVVAVFESLGKKLIFSLRKLPKQNGASR